jgi:uncharacterized protein (AIM24 family)
MEVVIEPQTTLIVKAGCISVMSGRLSIAPLEGLGEGNDLNQVVNNNEVGSSLTLGSAAPGTIYKISIKDGHPWVIRESSFVACSSMVKMDFKFNLMEEEKFDDQVVPLTRLDGSGDAYIYAFGKCHTHKIQEGDSLLVNGGLFLGALESDMHYSIKPAGSLFTSIAGISWVLMHFKGQSTILTQSNNLECFAGAVEKAQAGGGTYEDSDDSGSYESYTSNSNSNSTSTSTSTSPSTSTSNSTSNSSNSTFVTDSSKSSSTP